VTFANFALDPFDLVLTTATADAGRVVAISGVVGALLVLPGTGVAVLFGAGIALLAVYGGFAFEGHQLQEAGILLGFAVAWGVGAALRGRLTRGDSRARR
jgi:hypothetical protein